MLLVRERAPLRLSVTSEAPDGTHRARWAWDEHQPENALESLTFSSTAPGGYEQLTCTLQRQPGREYPDLEELSTIRARGPGGTIAWEGRLEQTPRQSGSQMAITPQAVGYQAALDDDTSARMIYVDADMSTWQPSSVQQKLNDIAAGIDTDDPTVTPDQSSGAPSLATQWTGPLSRARAAKGWYDAKGVPIGAIYYAWKAGSNVDTAQPAFDWSAHLSTNDIQGAVDSSANLRTTGATGSGSLTATAANRRFAWVQFFSNAAYGTGADFAVYWQIAVVGNHGLPLQAAATFTGAPGVLASDVIAHAIGKWCPELTFTTGPNGTIRPSAFIIPHLVFTAAGTASAIVKAAAGYELLDWFVWDNKTFYLAARGTTGRQWRARVYPANLQEAGPQIDRIWNGVLVSFTDVTGIARTAGPPGSGCDIEDPALLDTDPLNPANQVLLPNGQPKRRWTGLQMNTSAPAAAIKTGQTFLQEQKLLDTSGQAALVGHVEDLSGVLWPAWTVKAGDTITFVDAHDTSPRRVIRAEYAHDTRTCTVSLDQPPDGMQALLARIGAELQPLGF